jgi:hypothetical protein
MLEVAQAGMATVSGEAQAVIRPCVTADLPEVARLFRKTFLRGGRRGTLPLEAYLKDIFLDHPWRDTALSPLVYVDPDGTVCGFIGVLPVRLVHNGVAVRAASAGSLMVEHAAENPLAGARLMRAFFGGPQEFSVSDSANDVSQRMWERLGGRTAPTYSMEWLRVLRPVGFSAAVLADRRPFLGFLRALAVPFDALALRLAGGLLAADPPPEAGAEVDDAALFDVIPKLAERYALRPAWDRESLAWFLAHAAEKERYGPLVRRVVRGRRGEVIGASLYCVRRRGIAFVLQILAERGAEEAVVADLLADARMRGAVAVRGRVQPEFADALLRRKAVFLHVASTMVQSRRADLLAVVASGEALLTGFAGESWTRLIGGFFL